MNRFQQLLIRAQFATVGFIAGVLPAPEDRENGQSSAEYAGIIVVAVTIVLALITAASIWGDEIKALVSDWIGRIGG